MKHKLLICSAVFSVLSALFYVGEFVTGQLHFITKCDPPNELDCPNKDFKDVNFRGADLHGANFEGADLSGADLSYSLLYDANLVGAKLIGTNLYGASLNNVALNNADLSGANLTKTVMSLSNLSNANLSNANLSGADLSAANLTLANLINAEMLKTKLTEYTIFDKTIMPNGFPKWSKAPEKSPVNTTPNSSNDATPPDGPTSQIRAVSIRCQDGNTFSSGCAVTWSDGSRSYARSGSRSGSIVSGTDFYDMMGNRICVDLYENGAASSYNC